MHACASLATRRREERASQCVGIIHGASGRRSRAWLRAGARAVQCAARWRTHRRDGRRAPLDDRVGAGELGFVRRRTERPRVALAGSLLDADHFSRGRSDSLDWRGNRRSRSRDKLLPRPSRSSRPRRKAKLEGRRRSRQSPWTCGAAMSMGPPWREFAVKRRGNVTVGHASVIGRAGVQYKREGTK